ncbi:MAG: MlaD family protein [Actinomycetota bacterium]
MSEPPPRDPLRLRRAALGLVALGLFALALWTTWSFLNGGLRGGTPVVARFSAPGVGQQLPINGDVKVRGVLVGHIEDVRLEEGLAVVELRLDEDVRLPADSSAEIRSKTIFGQKWVELIPTRGGGPYFEAGSEIPDDRTIEPLELERALQLGHDLLSRIPLRDLSTVLGALAEGFTGREQDARTAIEKGLVALRAVNSRSDELDLSLRQLGEFSQWLADNDENLVSFLRSVDSANRALVAAAPEFSASLDSGPAFFDLLASFQERTEDDLGRLVEDGATVTEFVAARSDDLVDIVVQLEAFTTVWNSGLGQPCAGEFEEGLTCWQVYQLPGLDSRGVYRGSEGPLGSSAVAASETRFKTLLSQYAGRDAPEDLVRLLYAPTLDVLAAGGDRR